MRLHSNILSLPVSILVLISSHTYPSQAIGGDPDLAQWPYNLPGHVKYWPEDPPGRRRDLEAISEHLRLGRSPLGVTKMSDDEGEKFYMEYWQFEGDLEDQGLQQGIASNAPLRERDVEEDARYLANASVLISFRPPFALHADEWPDPLEYQDLRPRQGMSDLNEAAPLPILERAFVCPGGTSNCSLVGYPNSCCATDETCFVIQDTGLGPVGCCPSDSTCGGSITSCSGANTPCPDDLGGGCCIPNYVCAGVGCVINPTLVVTILLTETFTATSLSSLIYTSTEVSTITSSPATTTDTYTGLQTTLPCASSFHACPVNLGGGCCPASGVCASLSCGLPPGSTDATTATGVPPVRPNSDTSTTLPATTTAGASCPTGFYACEAYYAGGCCRTGRNCDTSSCPATSSTTIVSSGVTIVVPVGAAAALTTPTGSCATGWSSCAASDGGKCCPSGWQCGTATCSSLSPTSTSVVQVEDPGSGAKVVTNLAALVGGLMVILVWVEF